MGGSLKEAHCKGEIDILSFNVGHLTARPKICLVKRKVKQKIDQIKFKGLI